MFSRIFKITGLVAIAIVFANNIYVAANFYNISSIHLSDKFYRQSINHFLIDNEVEKVQLYGQGIDFEKICKKQTINEKIEVIYQEKRNSYRKNW